jgi:pimeloyl-ACP methyl ester carboxylesterase
VSFLDAVKISSCDLLGSSYGGTTAIMAAALAPERVRSLILVSPANPWSNIGSMRIAALKLPMMSSVFPRAARAFAPLNTFSIARMFGDSRRMPPDTVRGYNAAMTRPGVIEHAVRIVRNWKADMKELEAALPKIADVPTLVLWGSKDRVVDPRSAEILASHFHHAKTVVIKGAGHLPYDEGPEEFSRSVLGFLTDQSRTGATQEVT